MASSSSGPLGPNAVYQLGQYQFKLNVTKNQEGDSTQIQAQMTKEGQSKYHSIYVDGTVSIKGWYVEANESTADVYVSLEFNPPLITRGIQPYGGGNGTLIGQIENKQTSPSTFSRYYDTGEGMKSTRYSDTYLSASPSSISSASWRQTSKWYDETEHEWKEDGVRGGGTYVYHYTYDGKTVYYYTYGDFWHTPVSEAAKMVPISNPEYTEEGRIEVNNHGNAAVIAWSLIYYPNTSDKEELVARFAIETQQAVDPTQPEQWDEQPDTGDPQYRLDLTVWGALSGRHNDPLRDPSFSYVPADQDSVKGYGGGGDGGHGGGGGGGASTVIVYDFATDKAGSKEINAYARRHGYGSSGGRGGRGGDGCIIVYY